MSSSPYHEPGNIVNELLSSKSGGRGLKSIIFSKNKTKGGPNKSTYATVCKSMQHIPAINAVLNDNGGKLRKAIGFDTVHNKGLMYVMLYELLFSKYKSIRGGGKLKRMIIKHETSLREGVHAYISEHGAAVGDAVVNFPRYARVNVLQSSMEEMVKMMQESYANMNSEESLDKAHSIFVDEHVPDLLVLHPSASSFLHQDHEAVKSGKIVLQDKSSCFSALVLARGNSTAPMNCDFIDACAAPGNKTTHLAALVASFYNDTPRPKKNKGKKTKPNSTIFAFERSSVRYKILKSRVDTLVHTSQKVAVEPLLGDFLKSDPKDPQFANVRGILLDPSCSGSGIVNSPDRWLEDAETDNSKETKEDNAKRIQSLSNFQLVALKHAMSFPSVDRIVYSTCSVHDEENEDVVGKALSEVNETMTESDEDQWQLVSPACLRHWPRRGKAGGARGLSETQANCLIRCDGLDGDETNGFFVSYFERKRVANTDDLETKGTSVHDCNLPIYEGQFANTIVEPKYPGPTSSKSKDDKVAKKTKTKHGTVKGTNASNPKQTADNKAHEKIAKKKAKKLAWKQKQALQKAQRLGEKKSKAAVSTSKK
jgi:putative methyltransferase